MMPTVTEPHVSDGPVNWVIRSYEGVGPLLLGSTLDEIEAALKCRSILIDKGDPLPTAAFSDLGVHAHFAADATCEAIELMSPATPVFDSMSLLGEPFNSAKSFLVKRDPDLAIDSDGLTSEKLGLGLYAPLSGEYPERPAEGVIIFVRGYYTA